MNKSGLFGLAVLVFSIVVISGSQVVPVAVSARESQRSGGRGRALSYVQLDSVDWAVGYRIAVFDALGVATVSYEQMAAARTESVLSREIEGRGLSWTSPLRKD